MKIPVTDQDGDEHELEGLEGWRDGGDPRLGPQHQGRVRRFCRAAPPATAMWTPNGSTAVGAPSEEEEDLLYTAGDRRRTRASAARSCCADELDGLKLTLAPSASKDF